MDPLLISTVGLSKWESVFVQTTIDLASGMEIAPWRIVDDPEGADVLLVDARHRNRISSQNGTDSGHPIVVSYTADSDSEHPDDARGLTRPVGYKDLITVLKDIERELQNTATRKPPKASVVSMKVVPVPKTAAAPKPEIAPVPKPEPKLKPVPKPKVAPLTSPRSPSTQALLGTAGRPQESLFEKARPVRRFVEDSRLLGLLSTIMRHESAAAVSHRKFPTILVIPDNNVFVSFGNPTLIPKMFRDPATSFTVSELPKDVEAKALASDRCRPLGQLLYCAALFGSEGRMLIRGRPDDTLCLIGWPDFDAVPYLPEHLEIAKYMMANSTHLTDIASSTGVNIDIVIDFCNACEAVGLARRISDAGGEDNFDERGALQLFGRVQDLFKEPDRR